MKINITIDTLRVLRQTAREIGTEAAFSDLALEWCEKADARGKRAEQVLRAISETRGVLGDMALAYLHAENSDAES